MAKKKAPAPLDSPAEDNSQPANDAWECNLLRNNNGFPYTRASNITMILDNDPVFQSSLAYCDFSYRIIKRQQILPDMREGEWTDDDSSHLLVYLSNKYGFEPPDSKMGHALVVSAQRNRFHPVREYLESLVWDRINRLDHWLEDIYHSPAQTEYNAAVGSKFLIGSVARIFEAGCKMDNVMILEGAQGLRKSTSINVLYGDWFSDAPIPLGDKDSYQNIQGVWGHELAELDSFNRAETTTAKNFFSQRKDRYRPSYGRRAQDFPRQTVFIGTTNQTEYFKDYTGNRRYWPVKCLSVELELLEENRDQLWAEAVQRFKSDETWWISSGEERKLFEDEQDRRMQVDPWQILIEKYLHTITKEYVTSTDILIEAIKKDPGHINRADQNRISPIMHSLGWINKKMRIPIDANTTKTTPRHVYVRDKSV